MKKTKGFSLLSVVIVIIVTAIVSALATGVIMMNSRVIVNDTKLDITNDEDLQEFIEVYETILSKYYDEVDKKGMLNAAEEGMLNFLGDKYTTYLNDSEYKEIVDELSGVYSGIGIAITDNEVVSVTPDSPSAKAGLLVGDKIVEVNGIDVTEKTNEEIGSIIKNESVTKVDLKINRNGELLNFTLEKQELINPTIDYTKLENTSIGYIYIKNFSQNLGAQMDDALKKLESENITSLIIDVRDNVGGYLSSAEDVSSLFLQKGKTIYSLEANNRTYNYSDITKEARSYPIVVLINGNTASASEILAAALKDSYGATLVGAKSYGKGKVQQVVPLNSGDSVKYTSAKWLTPNGVCIDGIGLYPDYAVDIIDDSTDTQLSKAIELLS